MVRYFEDLTPGETVTVGTYELTREEIISFAEQFDPQPFHTDEDAAVDSLFGQLVASGLHTLCISVRLFVTEFVAKPNGVANMGGLGMDELRWHEPVVPGDVLSLSITVQGKRPSTSTESRGYVEFERVVHRNENEAVLSFNSHNIIERRPPDGR